jgi:CheY-like chemotaxis protein
VDSPQKLAFVVQSNRLQGLVWQALLKSQKLAVILEPTNGDLADCMSQIATAGLTLPDVIVLDAEAATLNPYEFCRWCRDTFPNIQIFLTRCQQMHVSDTERRWAKQQGANDFLTGFDRDTLMSNATENVKRILTSLDYPFLNEKSLLTVLLNIRRQLSTTQVRGQALPLGAIALILEPRSYLA